MQRCKLLYLYFFQIFLDYEDVLGAYFRILRIVFGTFNVRFEKHKIVVYL